MEEYNIQQTEQTLASNEASTQPRYLLGFVAGIVASVVIGALVALFTCWTESVYYMLVALATFFIGAIVKGVSHRNGFISALISAVCGAVAVVVFSAIVDAKGYVWDDGTPLTENMTLYMVIAALVSGWAGWKE